MTNYVSQQVSSGSPLVSIGMLITILFIFGFIVYVVLKVINKK